MMNRRSFLSALAATSLTPILPAQVFASGGIVNPDHCGFVGERAGESLLPYQRHILAMLDMPLAGASNANGRGKSVLQFTTYASMLEHKADPGTFAAVSARGILLPGGTLFA